MAAISEIGLIAAFAAGMISFLSPCVLPLVPGYVSYVSGSAALNAPRSSPARWLTLLPSGCFVLGFSSVFIALGASATLLSRVLLSYRYETNLIGGAIIIVFGIFATGLIPMPWLARDVRYHGQLPGGKLPGAYVLGLAFGFGWTPCIGPILGAILTVSAASATASAGIVLLTAYALGLGVPFLVSAVFTESLMRRMSAMRRAGRVLKIGAGAVMIVMGIAMVTGYMSIMSYWLLENFPIFSRIG
ncbi:MAG: cytochrome c biogenesis protein CcdA [Rhizobiales bacterium]|nr:cytochrome c biogenesis protein CcdA [Hyphomicrobiales bacterium]MBI3674745.1 cytochrome c biogenesis protein CcdA [Hyphomicrobiales bacterium]